MKSRAVRAANLTGWLGARKRPATLEQIARRYGASKRTAYRLVADLRAAGVLRQVDGRPQPPGGRTFRVDSRRAFGAV